MSPIDELKQVLTEVDLPAEVHAAVLTDPQYLPDSAQIVVWTDRPYVSCPRCGQEVGRDLSDHLPVVLNREELVPFSQQHSCGHWLALFWEGVQGTGEGQTVTGTDVRRTAEALAAERDDDRQQRRTRVEQRLRAKLSAALRRLDEPLGEQETVEDRAEEVRTGDELNPGVYFEDPTWVAWDADPDGTEDLIVITADDLAGTRV